MLPYSRVLQFDVKSLENRNRRLKLGRISLQADILKDRCQTGPVEFEKIMLADFILYLRSALHGLSPAWWPSTLVYAGYRFRGFELFARCQAEDYFDKVKIVLAIGNKEQLVTGVKRLNEADRIPRFQYDRLNLEALLCLDKLATK